MSGGVFVGRPDRTCVCGWECPKDLLIRLPEGLVLAVGDLSYQCPKCNMLIWEGAPTAQPLAPETQTAVPVVLEGEKKGTPS